VASALNIRAALPVASTRTPSQPLRSVEQAETIAPPEPVPLPQAPVK
jgi:hypothetical protein